MLLAVPAAAAAQIIPPEGGPPPEEQARPAASPTPVPAPSQLVEFSADQVTYDSDADVVTASGEVRMNREGNYLAAEQVVWDRKSGQVRALGSVVLMTPEGDKLLGESVELTDSFKEGTIQNLLVVLESGGRIAATKGILTGDVYSLENAIYSPCPVTTETGCPKRPSWSITAAKVIDDRAHNQVRFQGGRLRLFGLDLPLLPIFTIRTDTGGATGLLVPDIAFSSRKGL